MSHNQHLRTNSAGSLLRLTDRSVLVSGFKFADVVHLIMCLSIHSTAILMGFVRSAKFLLNCFLFVKNVVLNLFFVQCFLKIAVDLPLLVKQCIIVLVVLCAMCTYDCTVQAQQQ